MTLGIDKVGGGEGKDTVSVYVLEEICGFFRYRSISEDRNLICCKSFAWFNIIFFFLVVFGVGVLAQL